VFSKQTEKNRATQWKKISEMRIATCNVHTLYTAGRMNELMKEMDKYKINMCSLQEIGWPGKGTLTTMNYMILCSGHESDKHKFETGFCISRYILGIIY